MKRFARIAGLVAGLSSLMVGTTVWSKTLDWQDMRDWSVSCRDNRYCVALAVGKSQDGKSLTLKLERSAKERSKIFVTLAPKDAQLAVGMAATIDVVGHEHSFFGEVAKVYDGNEAAVALDPTDTSILKLRQGRFADVTINYGGSLGSVTYSLSLQGVSSVLAMMDVVQGRLDREDAAVVSGGEAAFLTSHYDFSAAKAPAKPQGDEKSEIGTDPEENITYPEETASQDNAADDAESAEESGIGSAQLVYDASELPDTVQMPGYRMLGCELPDIVQAFGAQVINTEPGVFLYLVPCTNADANVPYYVALETAGEVEILEFQDPSNSDGPRQSTLANAAWDQDSNRLTGFQYFSPTYDCGRHEAHVLSIDDKTTRLSQVREKAECDGKVVAAQSWPVTWRSESQ